MQLPRRALAALLVAAQARDASAHTAAKGIDGFYNGMLHPLTLPGEVLALLAGGLLIAQLRGLFERSSLAFLLGCAIGIATGFSGIATTDIDRPMVALAIIMAAVAAVGKRLPDWAYLGFALALGCFAGLASVPESGTAGALALATAGGILSANVILIYVAGGLSEVQRIYGWGWVPVAIRILSAWTMAIGVLLAALAMRAPG